MWGVAFTLGLAGSLHCVGMCGPLALVASRMNRGSGIWQSLIYNSSRLAVYAFLGVLFGSLGYMAAVSGMQKWVSVVMGVAILALVVIQVVSPGLATKFTRPMNFIFKLVGRLQGSGSNSLVNSSLLGMINGFLPCGLVYMAVAGSIIQASLLDSALFMLVFGLGTFPVMFILALSGNRLPGVLRSYYKPLLTVGMLAFGLFLLYRGLGMEFTTAINNLIDPAASTVICR